MEIKSVAFGILTPDEIRARSVLNVRSSLGKRTREGKGEGGVCDARLKRRFGHVEFAHPVPNGALLRRREQSRLIKALNSICIRCGRAFTTPKRTCEAPTGAQVEEGASGPRSDAAYDPADPRPPCGEAGWFWWQLLDGMYLRVAFDAKEAAHAPVVTPGYARTLLGRALLPGIPLGSAANWFWEAFPVAPMELRGAPLRKGCKTDDWTTHLRAIVRDALALEAEPPILSMYVHADGQMTYAAGDLVRSRSLEVWDTLCLHVARFQDSGAGVKSERKYGSAKDSVATRFTGPKAKFARLRGTCMSKRQDWFARLVCVCAPLAGFHLHDVGIPAWVASKLRLNEGDWVIVHRYPTLHLNSALGHRVRIFPDSMGDVLRIHMGVTNGYNADFDGDCMEVFAPQSEGARREVYERMRVDLHILDPQGVPVVTFSQNALMGAHLLMEAGDWDWLPLGLERPTEHAAGQASAAYLLNGAGQLTAQAFRVLGAGPCADWFTEAHETFNRRAAQSGLSISLRQLREGAVSGAFPMAVRSGAKGNADNLRQVVERLGPQQDWRGEPVLGGDVPDSFVTGVQPAHHFLHLASTRGTLVDAAIHTGDIGYLNRCIAFALEGLVQLEDGRILDVTCERRELTGVGMPLGTGVPRMIGHLAAMAFSPLTQSNLRSFHNCGTAGIVKVGLPQLLQLLKPSQALIQLLERDRDISGQRELLRCGLHAVTEKMGVRVADEYVRLLVARMTWDGRIKGLTYHQIGAEFGPLKQAAFERPIQTLLDAAVTGASDPCSGATEAILFSRRFHIGYPSSMLSGPAIATPGQGEAVAFLESLWGPAAGGVKSFSEGVSNSPRDGADEEYRPESPSYRPTSPGPGM